MQQLGISKAFIQVKEAYIKGSFFKFFLILIFKDFTYYLREREGKRA